MFFLLIIYNCCIYDILYNMHIWSCLWLHPQSKEIEKIWVPIADEKSPAKFRFEQQPILFPHRIMAYLFDTCGLNFAVNDLHHFWDEAIARGIVGADAGARNRIPLGVYGDAAQLITKVRKEKVTCIFINIPIFRPRSIRCSRFLVWVCDTSLLYLNKTLNTVLRWLVWSLNALYVGLNPSHRPGGRALTEKEEQRAGLPITKLHHKFQVTELRGDWEFHKSMWQFRSSWKAINICFRCPAKSKSEDSGLLYWNDSLDSGWCKQEFSTPQFISQMLPDRHICAWSWIGLILYLLSLVYNWRISQAKLRIVGCQKLLLTCGFGWKVLILVLINPENPLLSLSPGRPLVTVGKIWRIMHQMVHYACYQPGYPWQLERRLHDSWGRCWT